MLERYRIHAVITGLILIIVLLVGYIHMQAAEPRFSHAQLKPHEAVIMDASRRAVLYSGGGRMCAEPAPDVIGTLAASAQARGAFSRSAGDAGQIAARLVQQVGGENIFRRSQGIQALRDGMFRLCEAYMNGAIDALAYEGGMNDLITALNYMVPLEVCTASVATLLEASRSQKSAVEGGEVDNEQNMAHPNEVVVEGSILFLTQCLTSGTDIARAIARNASERSRAYTDVRQRMYLMALATVLEAYTGAAAVREFCDGQESYTHAFLPDLCAAVRFERPIGPNREAMETTTDGVIAVPRAGNLP